MIRQSLIEDAIPSSQQIFDLIVHAERHKKIVWTAGRVLREAALWKQVEELDYEERKIVLKRITGILEEFASKGHLQRRNEPQSIGYGDEIAFDYVGPKRFSVYRLLAWHFGFDDQRTQRRYLRTLPWPVWLLPHPFRLQ